MLDSQRFAYNWAVSRLKEDATLTRYDLQKEFAAMRRAISWLRDVPAIYQYAALHRARTAADISNKYGNGHLKHRSRKRPSRAVECEVAPTYVDNRTASLPGLGHVRLAAEQPYRYQAGTSRECSACHGIGERDGERFECVSCGRVMNADGNAACNIMSRGTDIMVPAGEGIALGRRELSGRTRNPPEWVMADPDCWRRTAAGGRESQACNRPATSSAGKHLDRYAYVARVYPSI